MNKRRWLNLLRVLISLAALGILYLTVDLGQTVEVLRQADWRYLIGALLLYALGLFIRSFRWYVLIHSLDARVRPWRLVHLYFVGQFFNTFLPTGFGGDVVKAAELTQDTDSSAAIGTVLLDRMVGLMVLFAMGLAVLPLLLNRLSPWLAWGLFLLELGGLLAGVLILQGGLLRRLTARLPGVLGVLSLTGDGILARIYAAVTGCGWAAVGQAVGISVLFNLFNVLVTWLCARAVGIDASFTYFLAITPLLAVSLMIPSVGGWGVREGVSMAMLSPRFGSRSVSIALGVALGGVGIGVGLFGGLLYLVASVRRMRHGDAEEP